MLAGIAWLAAAAPAGAPDVAALLAAGRTGEAEHAAREWLAGDPDDPGRWVLLADATEDPAEAEALYREALRLDPRTPDAYVGVGRVLTAWGQADRATGAFEAALALDPDHPGALIGRAGAARDPALAREAWRRLPGDPAAAVLLARLEPEHALDLLVGDAPAVRLARAHARLVRGDAAGAAADLAGLAHPEALRLGAWTSCLEDGAVDPPTYAAFAAARQAALVAPGTPVDLDPLVARSPDCAASFALRAAVRADRGDAAGALADWRTAHRLDPADPGLAAALGHALLEEGHLADAEAALASADPTPPDVALDLAEIARRRRDRTGAARILAEAEALAPHDPRLPLARADLAPDDAGRLTVLLEALALTHHPRLLAAARPLARALGREDALAAALGAPLPRTPGAAPAPDAAEEIVVYGVRESTRRLQALQRRLEALGYGEPRLARDGSLRYATVDRQHPWIELHPDGLISLQESGTVPVHPPELGPFVLPEQAGAPPVVGVSVRVRVGRVKEEWLAPHRAALLEAIRPELLAWREALCREGFEERLVDELPSALDALWRDGAPLDGGPVLTDPADRRAALLEWWATRTCTPEGDAVRALIARYLVHEVQASPWPVTPAELAAVNARRSCPGELVL